MADAPVRARLIAALDFALAEPCWQPEAIEALLRGTPRDAKGYPVAVCEACNKPEWMDGLIPTEGDSTEDGIPIYSGFVCPQCKAAGRKPE